MRYWLIYIGLLVCVSSAFAQKDSVVVDESQWVTLDELAEQKKVVVDHTETPALTQKEIDRLFWKPNPMRAVWLGAIVPGLGQI